MASKKGNPPKKGTLIRGADGALYFIPDSKMRAFSVPEKGATGPHPNLDEWAAGEGKAPLHAATARMIGDDVAVSLPPKTPGRRKPRLK